MFMLEKQKGENAKVVENDAEYLQGIFVFYGLIVFLKNFRQKYSSKNGALIQNENVTISNRQN